VIIVVLVFLQSWRATIIPARAIPYRSSARFAAMQAFGFSLNNLSLLSLVLAIGIVVDDAIVVVENIEHHLADGLSPRDAARKAMDEVSGPVVAVALVLCAVFVPTAFMTGSARPVLPPVRADHRVSTPSPRSTRSPFRPPRRAAAAPHGAKKDWFTRLLDGCLAGSSGFSTRLRVGRETYGNLVRRFCVARAWCSSFMPRCSRSPRSASSRPGGFIPQQDRGYCVVFCQLPDASIARTLDAPSRKAAQIARPLPGEGHGAIPGFNSSAATRRIPRRCS
jgi:multidrug efflux pump subunit AcrB